MLVVSMFSGCVLNPFGGSDEEPPRETRVRTERVVRAEEMAERPADRGSAPLREDVRSSDDSAPPLRPIGSPVVAPVAVTPASSGESESSAGVYDGLLATLWVQKAGEYKAVSYHTFRAAGPALDAALADSGWTAAPEQAGEDFSGLPPAIIVDIDETILDNSPFHAQLILLEEPYSEDRWRAWVDRAEARAMPGAVEFLRTAVARGVTVFYVSNRSVEQEEATRRNLISEEFPVNEDRDVVLLHGENHWTSDKSDRRATVAEDYRILLLFGDDLNDFTSGARTEAPEPRAEIVHEHAGRWGRQWFILPNPLYGSWEASLHGRDPILTEDEKRTQRIELLSGPSQDSP